MSSLIFKYDLEKDLENFLKGLKSVNSRVPTKFQQQYESVNDSDYTEDKVKDFLVSEGKRINFEEKVNQVENLWKTIEKEFISRCENMFEIKLPEVIIGYLSQNQKCTYNWRESYFFIYYDSATTNKTIMHELLHFFTHRKYNYMNIEAKKFNDIKESFSVLLNTDFADLMNGVKDGGYPQHQQMRDRIVNMRKEGLSVDQIFHKLNSNIIPPQH